MRRVKITCEGSFHHEMNRGMKGDDIYVWSKSKTMFLVLMQGIASNLKIRTFAYCIMDNQYYVILKSGVCLCGRSKEVKHRPVISKSKEEISNGTSEESY